MNPNEPLATRQYRSHERRRFVELDATTERHLNHLLQAGEQARLSFSEVLERLADFGVNVLRPRLREAPKLPEMWKDPMTNQWLPNPFNTDRERELRKKLQTLKPEDPDRKRYERELASIQEEQIAIGRAHPELAAHLKAMAERPWQSSIAARAAEFDRQAANAREEDFFANARKHEHTGSTAWMSAWAGQDPDSIRLARRESEPIALGSILGRRQDHDQTLLGRIAKEDRRLFEIVKAAQEYEKAHRQAQHEREQEQQRQRAIEAAKRADAVRDQRFAVTRTADGRVIVGGARAGE